jgi:Tfp pilus assembly protein PilO
MTKPRRNSLVVTIPLAAAAAAWVIFVFLPIQRAINHLRDETSQMQQYCGRSQSNLPLLQRTGRELANVRQRVASWDQITPSPKDLTVLLGQISMSIQSAGLRTTRFDPSPTVSYDRIAQIPVSLGVTGSFRQVFALLSKIEAMSPIVWIERLEIEKAGAPTQAVSCNIELVVFADKLDNSDQRNELAGR